MKVKLTQSRVGDYFSQRSGDEIEVDGKECFGLLKSQQAIPVCDESKKLAVSARKAAEKEQFEIQKRMAELKRNIMGDTPPDDPYGLGHVFTEVRTVGNVNFQALRKPRGATVSDIPTYVGKFTLRLRFKAQP